VPDSGPDTRGRKRALTRNNTRAIYSYLIDESVSQEDRGAPWQDIIELAGVKLGETAHFKPIGSRVVNSRLI
jgi:hypothetical protein